MKDFQIYRDQIIGNDLIYPFPYGERKLIYADWTASGRLYRPIENFILDRLGPFTANPHTDTTTTGTMMTSAYHQAQKIIKRHVNADGDDVILFAGFGMTAVINKLQRILGVRIPEKFYRNKDCREKDKKLVILTHMEHHSNQTTWNECCCHVRLIRPDRMGLPDLNHLEEIIKEHRHIPVKIGSFTACSNVTGIYTPYHEMAELMHSHDGYCFIDFAASAPYVPIDMHPENPKQKLDAVFFSPHKFLGGPGSSGVMVMNKELYSCDVPDQPGGGTVIWTNPWGEQRYYNDIEVREDGGTPGFFQAVKAALAVQLKEEMNPAEMLEKEKSLKNHLMDRLSANDKVKILEGHQRNRLAIVSFYSMERHHNLIVQLLNDRFGIQTRGGCSCAGTYGHLLFDVDKERSKKITDLIQKGDLSEKPGWVRISIHPTMSLDEVDDIVDSVNEVLRHYDQWEADYRFESKTGEFKNMKFPAHQIELRQEFRSVLKPRP